ncbi:magnesium and cobalt transporter, putative [Heliomicrobium modesticaldum Ice1]|uniref:Magnesium and cobalt transporter, putative n=1 Tax=Heliobacterium modesticaldum (strain ATCC 51547 / Ice1) TaxID=498761 RepID=B0TCD1_HELMI|nr:CorA family divalent cation transporter [Heliomicrobium modesticaldum]ABZ85319.1 magnesium and cobalt transporter, putative [Heliomicrobium modesticaldum Ice1]
MRQVDSGGITVLYANDPAELPPEVQLFVRPNLRGNRLLSNHGSMLALTISSLEKNDEALPVLIAWDEERLIVYSSANLSVLERCLSAADTGEFRPAHRIVFFLLSELFDQNLQAYGSIEGELDRLEESIALQEKPVPSDRLFSLRRRLLSLHQDTFAKRRLINKLIEHLHLQGASGSEMIRELEVLIEDLNELSFEIQGLREALQGLMELRLSLQGQRANQIMQKLTVVTSIFLPLTFIVGVYGMNFEVMPELHWPYGYYAVMVAMAVIAGTLLVYFRRRGWF